MKIFDARPQDEKAERELGELAQAKAYQLGQGAIKIIRWLWDNVEFWPA